MGFYLKEAGLAFGGWLVFIHVRNWLQWNSTKKWGEQYGCADARDVRNSLPWGLEKFSVILTGLKGIDFLEDLVRKRAEEMGCYTYRFHMFNATAVQTFEPENIQAVLATKFHDFELGTDRREVFGDAIGDGIFTADGEAWAHYRHQLKPQFTRDQISNLEAAEWHMQLLFKSIPEANEQGWIENVDFLPLLYNFTMDVATEFLFGQSVNSQTTALQSQDSGNMKDAQKDMDFAHAVSLAQEFMSYRFRLGALRHIHYSAKYKKACKVVKDFALRFVEEAIDPNRKRTAIPVQQKKYVLLDELVSEIQDPIELRDQILHILLAARDTTASLVGWSTILLARHPEEFKRVREAVLEQFGTEGDENQPMTFESLKACKAILYVLYEALRLFPLVPGNSRVAVRDTILPRGGGPNGKQPIAIKKGEIVVYFSYVLHRRKDIWGEDSDDFRPARWEGRKHGWEYIPFSGGPRICIGQQYALNEAGFVLAKILQKYDQMEAVDMTSPLQKMLKIVLSPKDVKVKLHEASS